MATTRRKGSSLARRARRRSIALGLCAAIAPGALLAAGEDPDWPCVQRLVPQLSAAAVWDGPPLAEPGADSPGEAAIAELASKVAARGTPLDTAEQAIVTYAESLGAERDARLTALFAAVFVTVDRDRAELISGIKRYARGQRRLAARIRETTAELGGGTATAARRRELQERRAWDTRIFEERQTSLQALCDQPVLLEQRLFRLAQTIRANMDS